MFSVPLRRALSSIPQLPYPEGVAAAEVLKVRRRHRARATRRTSKGLRLDHPELDRVGRLHPCRQDASCSPRRSAPISASAPASTGISGGLSFALFGAGHLVGISVGMAMLRRPAHRLGDPAADPHQRPCRAAAEEVAEHRVPAHDVRFFGAGVIGVAAIWTLLAAHRPDRRRHPLGAGRLAARAAGRRRAADRRARHPDRHRRAGHRSPAGPDRLAALAVHQPTGRSRRARRR